MKTNNSFVKKLDSPDERRDFKAHGHFEVFNLSGGQSVGRMVFEPGWNWRKDVGPIAGTPSCEVEHEGYCLKGVCIAKLDSGEEIRIEAGDLFYLPPGHDGYVEGNEPFIALDFTGVREYATAKSKAA